MEVSAIQKFHCTNMSNIKKWVAKLLEEGKIFFTHKTKTKSKITFIKKNCLPGRSRGNSFRKNNFRRSGCREVFNKFFINIVQNLKMSTYHDYDNDFITTNNRVTNAVNTFRNHRSIILVKKKKKLWKFFLWSRNLWWCFEKDKNSWHCQSVPAIWHSN